METKEFLLALNQLQIKAEDVCPSAAVVLYVLSGSIKMGKTYEFATLADEFARQRLLELKADNN